MKKGYMVLNIRYFLYALIIFSILLIAGLPRTTYSSTADFVDEKVFNFGTILEGVDVPHDFIIENRGDLTLRVLKVKSNCACAVASFTEEIAPGSKGTISVVFDSRGSGGQDVEHKIRVETDDPDNGVIDLAITGHVDPILIIRPDVVILSGREGGELEAEVLITHDSRHPVRVVSAESKKGYISVRLTEAKDSNLNKYVVKVKSLKKEKGKFGDFISLKTDSTVYPSKQIRVKIEIN
ncbi:MAG: DUF1573 domain-containing protein [Desulfatiglans sp.]|jgi:hypothetical protein|nr:DUF1573 domain-containing protein [Desulfatiglans sp.]